MSNEPKPPRVPTNRDVLVPKHVSPVRGVPAREWHEEPTGVHTDAQVFRAIKGLHDELQSNKVEAARAHGALKQEVKTIGDKVDGVVEKVDTVALSNATLIGKVEVMLAQQRNKHDSISTRTTVTETLATQVLAEQRDEKAYQRKRNLTILSGLFSAAVLGAIVSYLLGRL